LISVVSSTLASDPFVTDFVRKTIESLGSEGELILHLDGCKSVSGSLSVLNDKRLTILCTENRIGFSSGLNLCVNAAKHDMIGRIDADDIPMKNRWVLQQRKLEQSHIVSGLPIHFFPDRYSLKYLPHYFLKLENSQIRAILPFANPLVHPASAFRKESFDLVGGYGKSIAEDYEFWLKASLLDCTIERSLDYVLLYRHHKNQVTKRLDWAKRVMEDSHLVFLQSRLAEKIRVTEGEPSRLLLHYAANSLFIRVEFREAISRAVSLLRGVQ
jgi:glycosyltransferase involved in cell wall biosynthesis